MNSVLVRLASSCVACFALCHAACEKGGTNPQSTAVATNGREIETSPSQSQPSGKIKQTNGSDSVPNDWQADTSAPAPVLKKAGHSKKELPPLTPEEQSRYDRIAVKLIESINAHDKATYRALFTDEAWENAIDWYREMFAVQLMRFGKIERAFPPQRGKVRVGKLGIGGDARNGASFVAIFEDQIGGLFSIELNDQDQIVHSSIFIKQELAHFDDWDAKPIFRLAK